jgi:hypothetical protein
LEEKIMKKLYIVCWSSAGQDDDGNAKAFCGVHGVYTSKSTALKGLVECKNQTYDEIVAESDYDDCNIRVYGSEAEEYFEIDYSIGDTPCEIYITISEQ